MLCISHKILLHFLRFLTRAKCYSWTTTAMATPLNSCDVHQVLFCTIHRKYELKFLKIVIAIHDLDARSSRKVVAALITSNKVIMLSLGNCRGGDAKQTDERHLFRIKIKRFRKVEVHVLSHKLKAYLSMVSCSSFGWKRVQLKIHAACKMQPR